MMGPTQIDLLQFPYSHYNEKARWALDWKRIPHRRISYLPGPHAGQIRRLTGQTAVPVLRFGEQLVWGSARILDELERYQPDPPLYPRGATERARALELQHWFDEEVGPAVRRSLFATLLETPGYVGTLFAASRPWPMRLAYRAALPLVRGRMRTSMGITDRASIEAATRATREALEFVAREAGSDGHLVGDSFGVADLTAAALLAPVADPPASPMHKPRPLPEPLAAWMAQWEHHPGVAWVRRQYARHRPASAATAEADA